MKLMNRFVPIAIQLSLIACAPAAWANKTSATSEIAEARAMVRSAERSGADAMATVELKTARDLLNTAEVSLEGRNWDDAEYAARKAQRDAELADVKTQALKAEAALSELQLVVDNLRRELQRMGQSQ